MNVLSAIILLTSCLTATPPALQPVAPEQTATVSGYDFSRCVCCGGWIFSMENTRYLGNHIEGWELAPDHSKIIMNGDTIPFPFDVAMDFNHEEGNCAESRITIQTIELVKD
ncbi:MAG: hypothetical protein AAGA66_18465 [Bacteroidota bacterium]